MRTPELTADMPACLIDRPGFRLWHLHEHQFSVPKGNLYISIDSEHAVKSPRHIAMARLAVELLTDHLNALTYPAELAGLGYQIYAHQGGFTINLSGFADKQPLLLDMILGSRTWVTRIRPALARSGSSSSATGTTSPRRAPSPSCSTSSPACCSPTTRRSSSCCATCAASSWARCPPSWRASLPRCT